MTERKSWQSCDKKIANIYFEEVKVVPIKEEAGALETEDEKDKEDENRSESDDDECPIPNWVESTQPIKLSVTKAPPVVLKTVKTYSQRQPRRNVNLVRPGDQFMKEMRTKIIGMINEANKLSIDPRDYHPFYLEVQKQITLGQRLGFIGIEDEDVHEIWVEYNDLLEKQEVPELEDQELSSYALYIQNGYVYNKNGDIIEVKRDEEALRKRFTELENLVERISSKWRKKIIHNPGPEVDLEARLEFLNECKTMYHPADVIKMNYLWKQFNINCTSKPVVFIISSDDDVPPDFQCRVQLQDISKDRKWGSRVRRQLLKRKREALKVCALPPPPPKKLKTNPNPKRINKKVSKSRKPVTVTVPKRSKQATVDEMLSSFRKRIEQVPEIKNVVRRSRRTRSKSKKKPKTKGRKNRRKTVPRLSKEERAKLILREKRLKKFMRRWNQLQWSLIMTCRRRRQWELERIKRSSKVQLTLEKIISGRCRLRTFKNRNKTQLRGTTTKKSKRRVGRSRAGTAAVQCPFCDIICKNRRTAGYHVCRVHPTKRNPFRIVKDSTRQRKAELSRARWQHFLDTGEGPPWMWKRLSLSETAHPKIVNARNSVLCDLCGEQFSNQISANKHKAFVHNPEKSISKCPYCPETYKTGQFIWLHFLSAHFGHDITTMSKTKAQKMGIELNLDRTAYTLKQPRETTQKAEATADDSLMEYVCDECGKTFLRDEIKRHKKQVHGVGKEGDEEWRCDICNKTFKVKDSRDAHIKQIHEGQDFRCDICNRKMQTAGKLWRHKVEYHQMHGLEPPEGVNVMPCLYCGEQIMRGMAIHVKKNHPEKLDEYLEIAKKERQQQKRIQKKKYKRGYGYKYKSNEERNEQIRLKKQEMRRKWREEGIAEEPWIAKRPPKKCPHCHIDTRKMKQKSWPDHVAEEHGIIVDQRKWVCPVDGCKESFFVLRQMKKHVLRHSNLFPKLLKNKYVKEETSELDVIKEYHCLECKKNGKEETIIMVSEGEVRIHFFLTHPKIYNKFRDGFDPKCKEDEQIPVLETEPQATESSTNEEIVADVRPIAIIEVKKYSCPHCSAELFSDFDLRCHVEVTHASECWRCPISDCAKVMLTSEEMNEHFMEMHNESWT